ncbi:response regulator [Pedobacter jeongneungensis]|uniref:response regulator n=1 Tax=Pedobacter jeongneungensis TaxID=947309 RepID=UPI0004687226|nr:response regulator [Pedobacter jeongneungensis]
MDNKKILICDDDEGILDVLELILEETGHTVIPEQNSLNVRSILDKHSPDLVILDLWMPVLSGDQLLSMIRNSPSYSNLPVIIISASTDGQEIAMNHRASAFIAKPFDYENLISVVNKFLD